MCAKHDVCGCDKGPTGPIMPEPKRLPGVRLGYDYIISESMFVSLDPADFQAAVIRQLENMRNLLINKAMDEYASRAADRAVKDIESL